jgi:hypothetical protein
MISGNHGDRPAVATNADAACLGQGRRARSGLALALALVALAFLAALAVRPAAAAAADDPAATQLAQRYAPVVRLKEQPGSCDIGDPYQPVDINALMGNDEIVLRGPWDDVNVVKVAPVAGDLARGLRDYHLDFPGDALQPGCTYERWQAELAAPSVAYARVVMQADAPGRLALQYWFYYVFNDWLNKHEGDWEMIQLNFAAGTATEALAQSPTEVGYSQHSSGERAVWGDPKIELVDGTHPVVYPARGSQANFFSSELYLMRSQAEGMGCDDTTGPSKTIRPTVALVPTPTADYLREYPWLGFRGRWGERHASFFNGPTGPNLKRQWTEPFVWSAESWRARSFAVPAGGLTGTAATDIFCGVVASGSEALRKAKINPGATLLVVAALILLVLWGITRTTWSPASPAVLRRQRAWGQVVAAAGRRLAGRPLLFLGIGSVFVPLGLLAALVQWLVFSATPLSILVDEAGRRNAVVSVLTLVIGLVVALLGLVLAQAATAYAMVELDAGRRPTPRSAYRAVLERRRLRPLLIGLAISVGAQVLLDTTVVLAPVAFYLLVRWSLLAVVAGVDEEPTRGLLRRSAELTRRHFWRSASMVGIVAFAVVLGPLVGVILLAISGATFAIVNVAAAIIHVVAIPAAGIVLTYHSFDLAARPRTAPEDAEEVEAPLASS